MNGICRLNNKSMRNIRRDTMYQAIIADLAMLGIIEKEKAEMLIGGGVPDVLHLPDGSNALVKEPVKLEDPDEEDEEDDD